VRRRATASADAVPFTRILPPTRPLGRAGKKLARGLGL